ncbi:MAG TPA: hypothetical protein VJX67_15815 [Blastocatellia bacterium]|nr:hypothetical protein [Blastocatellia bacterium]
MIRKSLVIALMMVCAGVVVAATRVETTKLTGYIIDNACAAKHAKDDNVADEIKGHPKSCATAAGCAASGYALYADGKLYKLDSSGNKKVAAILKNTKSDKGLEVNVEGTVSGDSIKVKSISEASM